MWSIVPVRSGRTPPVDVTQALKTSGGLLEISARRQKPKASDYLCSLIIISMLAFISK